MTNYERDDQSFTTISDILSEYNAKCPEKENFALQVCELGIILKEVFPGVNRVQRRVNGSRMWQYPLAKTTQTSTSSDAINWHDLPSLVEGLGWQMTSSCGEFMEWVKIRTQEVCEGNRLLQEIKIFKDWSFTVFVNNRKLSKETLGNPEITSSRKMTKYLFDVVSKFKLCKGLQVSFKKTAKDLKGKVTATTEEWGSREDDNVELRLRSVDCRVLVNDYNRSSIILCDYCTAVKRNASLIPQIEGQENAAKKRESYMSEEELMEKLHREQTRRKNAERKLNYLRDKIENEMKAFEEEDHKDFVHMFQKIDKGSLSEDMQVFWEAQEKALTQKSVKGNRWHPK